MDNTISIINKLGLKIFYSPNPLLDYNTLVNNSLGPNTYRGFHKVDKNKPGSKEAFTKILIENSNQVIDTLLHVKNESELDAFEKELCKVLKKELKKNIDNRQLSSFNKLRKPVDLIVEHLISMGSDFSSARQILTEHLFLPLDSQMFQSTVLFNDMELKALRLKRNFTFKDIAEMEHYYDIQRFIKQKAKSIGVHNRIFFDLLWNDRYKSKGKNLFATNP